MPALAVPGTAAKIATPATAAARALLARRVRIIRGSLPWGYGHDGKPTAGPFALGHPSIEVGPRNADLPLVKRVFELIGLGRAAELHPALGGAIERHGERQNVSLESRERTAELSIAVVTLASSVLMAWFAP